MFWNFRVVIPFTTQGLQSRHLRALRADLSHYTDVTLKNVDLNT